MPVSRNPAMPDNRIGMISRLILIALCTALIPAGCARKPSRSPEVKPAVKQADAEQERRKIDARFEGARVTWDDDRGNRLWEAGFESATAAATEGASSTVELTKVEAGLYENGKVVSRMVAPRVVADSGKKQIRAFGGVKITSLVNGTTATAEEMLWKPNENTISGRDDVVMRKGNMTIRAQDIIADTALRRVKLSKAEAIL